MRFIISCSARDRSKPSCYPQLFTCVAPRCHWRTWQNTYFYFLYCKCRLKPEFTTRLMRQTYDSVQDVSLWQNGFPSISPPGPFAVLSLGWTFVINWSAFPEKVGYMTSLLLHPELVYFRMPVIRECYWLGIHHNSLVISYHHRWKCAHNLKSEFLQLHF